MSDKDKLPPVYESGLHVRNLGDLKALVEKLEASGATDATELWVSAHVSFKGVKADLMDTIQVGSNQVVVNSGWRPNFGPVIFFGYCTYEIPDPNDGWPYV